MVDFAVIQMSPLGGRLRQVAYADIRHGELHVHILNQQGTEIGGEHLRPVVTQKDVDEAYGAAIDRFVKVGRVQEEVASWMTGNASVCNWRGKSRNC